MRAMARRAGAGGLQATNLVHQQPLSKGRAMPVITAEVEALKDAHRKPWASGDYARLAELVTDVGERVVERAGVHAGSDVLDVAAGTGNASIPAPPPRGRVT